MSAERQAMRLVIVAAAVAAAMMSTAPPVYAGGIADAHGAGLPRCTGTAPAPHAPNVFDAGRGDPPIPQRRATPRRRRRTRNLSTLSAHAPRASIPILKVPRTLLSATSSVSERDRSDDDDADDDAPSNDAPTHDRSEDRDCAAARSDQDADNSLDDDDDDADGVIVISATNHTSIVCEPTSHVDVRPIVTIPLYVCADTPRRC